jgi:hypothetical protein
MKNKYAILAFLMLLSLIAGAQNTTPEPVSFIDKIFGDFLQYGLFVLAIYEVVVRFFPTVKSYSLLSELIRLLQYLVPDNANVGGTHLPIMRSISVADIKIGDTVRTHDHQILKVKEIQNGQIITTTEGGTMTKKISIEDILEIVKKGYLLVDTIKAIISFFKTLFK